VPEIQQSRDPQTGEITTWRIPPEEALGSIRRAVNRTMRNATETVSNLQNQISETGLNIMDRIRRRRPRLVPTSDNGIIEDIEGRMRWDNEMRQNAQSRNAANKLTAAFKRKKEENTIGFKTIENENDQLMDAMQKRDTAATKIQKVIRGHNARDKLGQEILETNAIKIQKVVRGHKGRKLQKEEAVNKLTAAIRRKKEENTIGFKKIENENDQLMETIQKTKKKAEKIAKGQEILDQMRYNQYLKEEPVRAFGELSRGALTKQRKAIQQQLKQGQGQALLQDITQENVSANFDGLSSKALKQQRKGIQEQLKSLKNQVMDIKPLTQATSKSFGRMSTGLLEPSVEQKYIGQLKTQAINKKANQAAIKIQSATRNRKALKELYKREDRRDQYKNLVNSGEIQEAFNKREIRRTNATTIQSAIRNKRAKNAIETASHNFNPEGYQELLRKNLKASQSQISHIDTRSKLPQSSKDKIIEQANKTISRIDNLITKKSKSGRTRTRSGTTTQEPITTGTGRLSMLSTTSTQGAMTPKRK
jgi:hypothetical protein